MRPRGAPSASERRARTHAAGAALERDGRGLTWRRGVVECGGLQAHAGLAGAARARSRARRPGRRAEAAGGSASQRMAATRDGGLLVGGQILGGEGAAVDQGQAAQGFGGRGGAGRGRGPGRPRRGRGRRGPRRRAGAGGGGRGARRRRWRARGRAPPGCPRGRRSRPALGHGGGGIEAAAAGEGQRRPRAQLRGGGPQLQHPRRRRRRRSRPPCASPRSKRRKTHAVALGDRHLTGQHGVGVRPLVGRRRAPPEPIGHLAERRDSTSAHSRLGLPLRPAPPSYRAPRTRSPATRIPERPQEAHEAASSRQLRLVDAPLAARGPRAACTGPGRGRT